MILLVRTASVYLNSVLCVHIETTMLLHIGSLPAFDSLVLLSSQALLVTMAHWFSRSLSSLFSFLAAHFGAILSF